MPDNRLIVYDGTKAVSIDSLPESAWRHLSGSVEPGEGTPPGMYQAVPWVYRAVELRALAMADLPWAITRASDTEVLTSGDWKPVKGLEWTRNLALLLRRTEQARCIYGRAYWLRERNRVRTLGYRWLAPPSIEPVTSAEAGLVGWKRRVGGTTLELPLEDLVYFWLPSVTVEIGPGPAPVYVALRAAGVVHSVDLFAEGFFSRGAINATILSVPPGTPDAEIRKLEAWWKRLVGGVKRAWETVGLRSTVVPTVLSNPPKDLAMKELSDDKKKDIAVALGVPYTLLYSEASNLATAEQDDLNFYTKTILPESQLVSDDLNRQVFEPAGYRFAFQPGRLELFEQLESKKAFALIAAVNSGVMLPDEWRERMDMEPLPDGQGQRVRLAANPKFGSDAESRGQVAADEGASSGAGQAQSGQERRRWERKALKALKDGRPANVPFETECIDGDAQAHIRLALSAANSTEEVRAAFGQPPFRGDEGDPYP